VKEMKRLAISLGILAIGAILFMRLGVFNVSATDPHWPITYKILEMARDWSVEARAANIPVPPLDSEKLVKDGAVYYHHTCRLCHGGPRLPRADFAKGLYPVPPGLTAAETINLKDPELFWIVKHGIKMTGMPSFGVVRDDQDLWSLVAFLRKYPALTVDQYEEICGYDPSEG
jgi:mono/diheme cytochrome c family protein